tara:strand:+ start:1493 stop:3895 length:2403 start_codon:yes stop_codon:yes gene_type:complete
MPRIPLYNQGLGPSQDLASGGLSRQADVGAFTAPGRALASFGNQVSDIAFRFGQEQQRKEVEDQDVILADEIERNIKTVQNNPDLVNAVQAKANIDAFREKTFSKIDGFNMTQSQKRLLKNSASKRYSLKGIEAEQTAHNRGLGNSAQRASLQIDNELDALNTYPPGDPRAELTRANIKRLRDRAQKGGYVHLLPTGYQTADATENLMAGRQTTALLADQDATEAQIISARDALKKKFTDGDINDSVYRANSNLLENRLEHIKNLGNITDAERLQPFYDNIDDLIFRDDVTYAEIVAEREAIENMTGPYSEIEKGDRRSLISRLSEAENRLSITKSIELSETIAVQKGNTARTGVVTSEAKQALEELQLINPQRAAEQLIELESAQFVFKAVGNTELMTPSDVEERIVAITDEAEELRRKGDPADNRRILVLENAAQFAREAEAKRRELIRNDPKGYYDNYQRSVRGEAGVDPALQAAQGEVAGAGYYAWAQSMGLRDDEISVFSSAESERIIEQFNQASALQKAQIINDVVAQYPGIGEHIVMRSFYKAGMDAGQNLTAFLASSPLSSALAADLQQALVTDEKDLNQFVTGDTKEQLTQALIIAMKPFNDSILGVDSAVGIEYANRTAMTGSGDQSNQRDGFVGEINEAAMKLAKYYVSRGKTPDEAAKMAARVHTSRFVYGDVNGQPLRIDRGSFNQTEADAIASGLSSWVQESLNVGSIMLEDGDEQATRIVIEDLKRGGAAWITSPDGKSAYLVNQRLGFVPVLNRDGRRITINFSSLPTKIGEIAPPTVPGGPAA